MTIIEGKPEYAYAIPALIRMSDIDLIDAMFGKNQQNILAAAYKRKRGHYSHTHSLIAVDDNNKVIAVCMYIDSLLAKKELLSDFLMFLNGGFDFFKRVGVMIQADKGMKDILSDEYYISHLAVLLEYRSQGIGRALLNRLKSKAIQDGFVALSLDVLLENTRAFDMYKHYGFQVVEEYSFCFGDKEECLIRMRINL